MLHNPQRVGSLWGLRLTDVGCVFIRVRLGRAGRGSLAPVRRPTAARDVAL